MLNGPKSDMKRLKIANWSAKAKNRTQWRDILRQVVEPMIDDVWDVMKMNQNKLTAIEMDSWKSRGLSRRDRVRNDEIRNRIGFIKNILDEGGKKQLK